MFNWLRRKTKRSEYPRIIAASSAQIGKERKIIEDDHLLSQQDSLNGPFFAIIADGMGGHDGGSVAARNAVRTFADIISQATTEKAWCWPSHWKEQEKGSPLVPQILKRAIFTADAKLTDLANQNPTLRDMGTTFSAIALEETQLHFIHVGDSRLYHINTRHEIQLITKDHVFDPSEKTRIFPPGHDAENYRGCLTQYLGRKTYSITPQSGTIRLSHGDFLFLCSDGLHGTLNTEAMKDMIFKMSDGSLGDAAKNLVQAAHLKGTTDDITVVLCQVL